MLRHGVESYERIVPENQNPAIGSNILSFFCFVADVRSSRRFLVQQSPKDDFRPSGYT